MKKLILTSVLSLLTLVNPLSANAILNGTAVTETEYRTSPLVAIFAVNDSAGEICSGVLLNGTTILTAAHCFDKSYSYVHIFRSINPYDVSASRAEIKINNADAVLIHPSYNSDVYTYDLAIIKLNKKFPNSNQVIYPILDDSQFNIEEYTFYGYGDDVNKKFGVLKTAIRSKYKINPTRFGKENSIEFDQTDLIGISSGDSGGPVMAIYDDTTFLIAINSTVISVDKEILGSGSSFVTKVSSSIDWIRSNM
ncbi:MAG: S1 family peptidase [Bdellovibrionota bacterium]|mgnify:CR=1 FL=1